MRARSKPPLPPEAAEYYWYHCVDLGGGAVTDGDYDMAACWDNYRFPDVSGLSVLDVGRASGYFSFEFERRGAKVTATEIRSFLDWDFVGGEAERQRRKAQIGDDIESFTKRHIRGAFLYAHKLLGSQVRLVDTTIYEISPETTGTFDVVFAGSITSHLRDPIRGLEALRSVTKPGGLCIVAAPYAALDESLPLSALVVGDPDKRSWWVLNKACLVEMLRAAGFSRVNIVDSFDIKMRRQVDGLTEVPHIVAHAR